MMRIIIILAIATLFSSCEKIIFEKDLASTNPMDNFEYLWNECDEKYSYFTLKQIDWDSVKLAYSSKLYDGMTEDSLFNVLGSMLSVLKDDHTNLISNFNVSSYGVRYQSPPNIHWRTVHDHYLSDPYYSGPFVHDFIANGQIGYILFPSFSGIINTSNLDFALERYKDTKGVIIDLRENGGGAVSDVFALLSRFVENETLVNYSLIKNGPGHDDFSDPEPVMLQPNEGTKYSKKVAILTDRGTYSAGSFTSLASKAIPNLILIGDTTGGGLGLPNGGQLPNGWTYRFSITQALTLDKSPDFENGVPPDITALFDWNDLTKDEVIERALQELL